MARRSSRTQFPSIPMLSSASDRQLRGGPDRHPWGQVVHALFLSVRGQKVEVPGAFEKVGRDL